MDRRNFIRKTGMAAGISAASLAACTPIYGENKNVDTRFNVHDFGAKGDGVSADSEAIQKALDEAAKVNGTVWFPNGVYRCHDLQVPSHVTLLADPTWIFQCELRGAVLELDDTDATCMLNVSDTFGVRIHGLVICGQPDAPKPIHGIYMHNGKGFSKKENTLVVDDTKVMNFSGHGIMLHHVWLYIIRHSQCMSNKGDGLHLNGWDGFLTDNQFSANGCDGVGCEENVPTVMFTANRIEWNHHYGLHLCQGDDWNITGNSFDRNYGAGLCAEGTTALAVTGNVFRRCGKDSKDLAEGEQSCQVKLDHCSGLSMMCNAFLAGQDDGAQGLFTPQVGMIVHALEQSVIMGNTLWHGYMNEMIVDKGDHKEFIFKDNVGSPMKA